MSLSVDNSMGFAGSALVEGTARVVAVDGAQIWLVPEQTTSCGGCASSGSCGSKGIGTVESRLEMRRFPMANRAGLVVGERVVVGIAQDALVKASLTVYILPLVIAFAAGLTAQSIYGSDFITMISMAAGLVLGFGGTWLGARRLSARGAMAPLFLRRAGPGDSCHIE